MEPRKTISLLQPWATLWVLGLKIHETRSWYTPYRGPLLIHASKGKDPLGRRLHEYLRGGALFGVYDELRQAVEQDELPPFDQLPFGAIIGELLLCKCLPTSASDSMPNVESLDYMLGNYEYGRFAWRATDFKPFANPIPCKGSLGIWNASIHAQ